MALQIPCPKCGAVLKLRDRSMLGRVGKCPKCGNRFTLSDPDVVELELAAPAAEEPVRVAAARRVTEESPAAPVSPVGSVAAAGPQGFPSFEAPQGLPAFEPLPAAIPSSARPGVLPRKVTGGKWGGIAIGGVIAVVLVGLGWLALDSLRPAAVPVAKKAAPTQDESYLSERDRLIRMGALIAGDSPTKGEPITLKYVPAGASVVLHLHPAELWKAGTTAEETRFCLGDGFQKWSEGQISKYCLFPPVEIEQATICLILGARGSEPEVATVVRLVTPRKRSEMIEKFGAGVPKPGESVYVGPERAFAFGTEEDSEHRPVVFATAPAGMADDLARSLDGPGLTSEAIRRLLEKTDRQRHLTAVFQPGDLRVHEEVLVPADLRDFWNQMLDRFDKEAEAVAWSLHFAGKELVSELTVRNDARESPSRAYEVLTKRLNELPAELVATVSKMKPASVGDRKLIGRLPAMAEVYAAETVGGVGDRLVSLQTRLPERAGPNLALAGLLAWNESTRTDFTKPAGGTPSSTEKPATLAEKLKKPIDVDFRRTPLEEAFTYIGGESGVDFEVDGEALKFAGYTKNMPQTFNLGKAPAEKAVASILKSYDKMCVVLDEANKKAVVMTKQAAQERGLTPASFSP